MENEFRSMRRFKQQLTEDECRALLRKEIRGVLAVNGENGYPYAFPMNFYFNEKANTLYMHSAKTGHKVDVLRKDNRVCFCLHDEGWHEEGQWQTHVQSVVIFGRIRFVDDAERSIKYLKEFDEKFEPSDEAESDIKRVGALVQMLELEIDHMTGKRVLEG